jgi:hypothetical protein
MLDRTSLACHAFLWSMLPPSGRSLLWPGDRVVRSVRTIPPQRRCCRFRYWPGTSRNPLTAQQQKRTLLPCRWDGEEGSRAVAHARKLSAKMNEAASPDEPPKPDGEIAPKASLPADRFVEGFDFIAISGDMDEQLLPKLFGQVSGKKKHDKVVCGVMTLGGDANVAYKLGRYLQTTYDEIVIFIPFYCKSAGTLLAISGHSIIMSPFGELGPLDVQLREKDEITGRRSGLITRSAIADLKEHAFELFEKFMLGIITSSGTAISFRTAADVAANVTGGIMASIYSQINPESPSGRFMHDCIAFAA